MNTNEIKCWGIGFIDAVGLCHLSLQSDDKKFEQIIREHSWEECRGDYFTPGGDPSWVCGACGGGEHIMGIESPKHEYICPDCGGKKLGYYDEDESWWENASRFYKELGGIARLGKILDFTHNKEDK